MPTKDPEKLRAKNKRYWEKNRDRLNAEARAKAHTEEGKAKRREYAAAYRAKHPKPKSDRVVIKGPITEGDPRHGTMNGYKNLRCRCEACTRAATEQMRDYQRRRKAAIREIRDAL